MRTTPRPIPFAIALVAAAALVACDGDTPEPSDVPGVSSDVGDTDAGATSLPALTDPQMTPAPNPDAGGGGSVTGSAP